MSPKVYTKNKESANAEENEDVDKAAGSAADDHHHDNGKNDSNGNCQEDEFPTFEQACQFVAVS